MKSTKKYFNSSKGFNKRIKKQASALPTAAQTTTMQTTANQGQAQADLAQANALQIEAINQQLRVQEERERQLSQTEFEISSRTLLPPGEAVSGRIPTMTALRWVP